MRPWAQAPHQRSHLRLDPRTPIDALVYIPTRYIVFTGLEEFSRVNIGEVRRGDWDRLCKRFDQLDIFVAFDEVIHRGLRWQDTAFFHNTLSRIVAGEPLWDCRSRLHLERRCGDLERLYRQIARDGYLNQQQVRQRYSGAASTNARHEIIVGIGRHGDILFGNGAHRLSIAKHLGLPEVPVRVAVRHEEWVGFQHALGAHAEQSPSKQLCQPVDHPDLGHLPADAASIEIFRRIGGACKSRGGKLLDLGARLGYFCRLFGRQGFDCFAFEPDPRVASLLARIREQFKEPFQLIEDPTPAATNGHDFAVTLLLGGFDRPRTSGSAEALGRLLAGIQTEELFLACRGPSDERTARQLAERGRFHALDDLGIVPGVGRLYHLHRSRSA